MSVNDKSPYSQLTKQKNQECKNCKKFKQKLQSIGQKVKKFKSSYLIAYKQIFQQMMEVNIQMNKKNSKQILQQFSALVNENKILKSLLAKVQQMKNINMEKNHKQIQAQDKENIQTDNMKKKKTQEEIISKENKEKSLQQLIEISRAELQQQRMKYSQLEALYKSSLQHNHRCQEQFLILVRQTEQIKQTLTKLKTFQHHKHKQKFQTSTSIFFNQQNSEEQLSESRQLQLSSQQIQQMSLSHSYELQTIKEVSEMDYQNEKQFKQYSQQQEYHRRSQNDVNYYNCNRSNFEQKQQTFSSSQLLNNSLQQKQNLSMTRKFSINNIGFEIDENVQEEEANVHRDNNIQEQGDVKDQRKYKISQKKSGFQDESNTNINQNNRNTNKENKSKSNCIKNIVQRRNELNSDIQQVSQFKSKSSNSNGQSQCSSLTITEAASIMNINIHNSCFLYDDAQNQNWKQQKKSQVLESPKNYLQALNILKSFNSSSCQEEKPHNNINIVAPLLQASRSVLAKNRDRNKQNSYIKDSSEGQRQRQNMMKKTYKNQESTNNQQTNNQSIGSGLEKIDTSLDKNNVLFNYKSVTTTQKNNNNEISQAKLSSEKQGRKSFGKCWKTKDIKNQIMALNCQGQTDELKQLSELKPSNLFNTKSNPKVKANLTISYQNNEVKSPTQLNKHIKETTPKMLARINPYYRTNNTLQNQNFQIHHQKQQTLFKVEGPLLSPEIKQEIKDFTNIIHYQNIFGGDMFRIKYKSGLEYQGKIMSYKNKKSVIVIPQGYGTLLDGEKNMIYTGEWKQGVFNGQGKLLIANTQSHNNKCYKSHNNKKTFTTKSSPYSSRSSKMILIPKEYNGKFVNCQLEGDGTLIFTNGNKLICKMSQSSIQGQGVYFNNNNDGPRGTVINGRWSHNEMIQEMISEQR